MKRILKYIVVSISAVICFTSCKIDRLPETEISDGNFWNSAADVRLAANYFYSTIPSLSVSESTQDNWSDDAYPNMAGNNISDGSRVTPATSTDYNYYPIYQANKLLEMAPLVIEKGASEIEVNRYIGEARFFRAWYYFEMLKRFGGVPLITKTMQIDDPDVFLPRASRDDILDLIYEDLEYAISVLRTADELQAASEYGRISRTAALAFKSRVGLFEGTRAKYHNYGNPQQHLNLAKDAAGEVIASGDHAIYSTPETGENGEILNNAYFNLFQEIGEGRANRENIIVRIYGQNDQNNITTSTVQRTYEGNNMVPTQNFVSQYLMADGLPIDKSPLYVSPDVNMTHAEYFEGKDPRMSFTLFKRGDEFITGGDYTIPNTNFQRSGFGIRKYANRTAWATQRSFIDKPVIRYAEILLNYAEAVYELEGGISDADLELTVNEIRSRLPQVNIGTDETPNYVNLPKLTNAFVVNNGLSMLEEIRRERRIELAFEGFRYWDLIRWKTAEIELPKTLLGSYFFTEYTTAPSLPWPQSTPRNNDNYIILQSSDLRRFDPLRDYLWPIPNNERARNPAIEQNPEW